MTDDLIKQIAELKEKALRYDNTKDRNTDYSNKINDAIEILQEVINDLLPTSHISSGKKWTNRREDMQMFWELIMKGTELTSKKIMEIKSCDEKTASNFIVRLKTMKGVENRKEKGKTFLFARKNY